MTDTQSDYDRWRSEVEHRMVVANVDLLPPLTREAIADRVAAKILGCPAISEEYLRAIILDALEEAGNAERYCAEVEKVVLG